MRRWLGLLAAGLIFFIGAMGVVSPDDFRRTVGAMQIPPALYFAAGIRVAVGVGLVAAASLSRAPWALRLLGTLIAIGGIITPFIGEAMARVVLSYWDAAGGGVMRLWGAVGVILGALIGWALTTPRGQARALANEEL